MKARGLAHATILKLAVPRFHCAARCPLARAKARLRAVPVDNLVGLCDAAARNWTQPDHPMADFLRAERLGFLPLWLRRPNLRDAPAAARFAGGRKRSTGSFTSMKRTRSPSAAAAGPGRASGCRQRARAGPDLRRAGDAHEERESGEGLARSPGVLPHLLAGLAEAEYTNAAGQTLSGRLLTDATAVVYCDREDEAAGA